MYKIAEVNPVKLQGMLTVYYDEGKKNPYRLFREWNEPGPYGVRKRRKQLVRYANLLSCRGGVGGGGGGDDEDGR